MKKIQLTENELKRMIVRVMEQMNAPSNEGGSGTSLEEYKQMFNRHVDEIYNSISNVIDLYQALSRDTVDNLEEKEHLMYVVSSELEQLGVDSREYKYSDDDDDDDQTIDVDYTEVDDEDGL
jgi:Rad3-related DNA helicase